MEGKGKGEEKKEEGRRERRRRRKRRRERRRERREKGEEKEGEKGGGEGKRGGSIKNFLEMLDHGLCQNVSSFGIIDLTEISDIYNRFPDQVGRDNFGQVFSVHHVLVLEFTCIHHKL